jgi:hypothetical protein
MARAQNPAGFANVRAHAAEHAAALVRMVPPPAAKGNEDNAALPRKPRGGPALPTEFHATSTSAELHTTSTTVHPSPAPGDHWVTIDGRHILIGESGGGQNQPSGQTPASRQPLTPQEIVKQIPPQIRAEMAKAIDDSNRPTADDKKGGFHEEIGVAGLDVSGKWLVWREKPGPYANPDVSNEVGAPRPPTDLNVDYPVKTPKVFFHVHPAGETATHAWKQPPSDVDKKQIFAPGIYIVFGAREKNVYFYDSSGVIGKPIGLRDFLRMPYVPDDGKQ